MGSSGVGSENGVGAFMSDEMRCAAKTDCLNTDAYHAYTTTKSTIINYTSTEEALATDDWFREEGGQVRYG